MWCIRLAAAYFACISAGCAALVAGSGKDLNELKTQAEVRELFGTPKECGTADGLAFDEFHTRRKLSHNWKGLGYAMGDTITLFTGEIIWFPKEVFLASRDTVMGQTVRFNYWPDGYVSKVAIDGETAPVRPNPRHEYEEIEISPTSGVEELGPSK